MKQLAISIYGQRWRIRFVPEIWWQGEQIDGLCVHDDHVILISDNLKPRRRVEVIVHELLHAIMPRERENVITAAAAIVRDVLVRLYPELLRAS